LDTDFFSASLAEKDKSDIIRPCQISMNWL
jgi:hypothetical protein